MPLEKIAETEDGDVAYYSPYAVDVGCMSDGGDFVRAPGGGDWLPSFLDAGRLSIFIAGNPGAGKSYLAKEIINTLPPIADILLFTSLEERDGNFEEFGDRVYKIRMEPENLERLSLETIRKVSKFPILLFDDVDKIRDKKVETALFKLMNDALANGRGHKRHDGTGDIHVICTSHALNDYVKTKYTLENSDYVALFPGSTTKAQYERMCNKLGISRELCELTYQGGKKNFYRYVIIKKTAPMYIMFGDTITLI